MVSAMMTNGSFEMLSVLNEVQGFIALKIRQVCCKEFNNCFPTDQPGLKQDYHNAIEARDYCGRGH